MGPETHDLGAARPAGENKKDQGLKRWLPVIGAFLVVRLFGLLGLGCLAIGSYLVAASLLYALAGDAPA